ncbi:MAG: hypothetical protein H6973_02905 [Gammaproteobacteria bacterium]|nr:hypothetical protein [Gammaproteobacteria bacterium]HRX69982.1 hypothetical protein [Candidatus Competibacteraceae bacterium]
MKIYEIMLLVPLLHSGFVHAQENWWDKSKETARDIWNQSRQVAGSAINFFDTEEQNEQFSKIWDELRPKLDKVSALEEERKDLPESSLIRRDKQSNQEDINEILDEAIDILGISNARQIRQEIDSLEKQIQQARERITGYHQEQVSAPVKSNWKTTVDDYARKIDGEKQLIEKYQQEIEQKKQRFLAELNQLGLQVSREQLDLLLTSVVGNDIIQNTIVYSNVRLVSQQLMELTTKTGEDLNISKRYYGMYTVLLKILLHMQNSFITEIDQVYLPRIAQIKNETVKLMANSRNLLYREADDNRRTHLKANIEAQELTLKTADLYSQHLGEQRRKMIVARDKTQIDLRVALNTYDTVKLSGELVNLLRSSSKSFDELLNIQAPDLLVFQNLQMKEEFSALTTKLRN